MNVSFIHTLIPQVMIDGLFNALLFEVGNLYVSLGMIDNHAWDDCWHIRVRGGRLCLGHDDCLAAIYVDCKNVPLHLHHITGILV